MTAEQAEAVTRWRKTVRGIAVEEMLHLALVSNLMTAIGAAPVFGRPNFPQRSGYFPSGSSWTCCRSGSRPCGTFSTWSGPRAWNARTPRGLCRWCRRGSRCRPMRRCLGAGVRHIGHLYRGIAGGLSGLCARLGERAVFVGSPRAQVTPELLRWPS